MAVPAATPVTVAVAPLPITEATPASELVQVSPELTASLRLVVPPKHNEALPSMAVGVTFTVTT